MAYSEKFSYQWDNLISRFSCDMNKLPLAAITYRKAKDWYDNNSYIWGSIVETEGVTLSNLNNKQLSLNLINAIKNFSFDPVSMPKAPSIVPRMAIGGAVAVALGVVFKLLHWSWILVVVETIVCLLSALMHYAMCLDKYAKDAKKRVINGYTDCLKRYKSKLLDICRKYDNP